MELSRVLSRALRGNLEQRALHPEDPSHFMASELALDEALSALLDSVPESLDSALLQDLLLHENVDIAGKSVLLLQELLEQQESPPAVLNTRILSCLVQLLYRLEQQDAEVFLRILVPTTLF